MEAITERDSLPPLCIDTLGTFLLKHAYDITPQKIVSMTSSREVGGFVTDTRRIRLSCILGSGRKKTISVIVKLHRKWEEQVLKERYMWYFTWETRMYNVILPEMEILMDEFDDKRNTLWPKMYGCDHNMIALEDLSESGYAVNDRRKPFDLRHSILVLRSLGRYHAMSMELIRRGRIGECEKGSYRRPNKFLESLWTTLITKLCDAMIKHWGEEWIPIANKLSDLKETVSDDFYDKVNTFDEKFMVLNHGDPWNCNMMFQYSEIDPELPIAMKFLDFQIGHMNSFICDLSCIIFTSVDPFVRRRHLNALYEHYQDSLAKNLEFFGFTGYVPTLEDVKSESKRFELCHMVHVLMSGPFMAECEAPWENVQNLMRSVDKCINDAVYSTDRARLFFGDDYIYFYENGIM